MASANQHGRLQLGLANPSRCLSTSELTVASALVREPAERTVAGGTYVGRMAIALV